MHNQAVEHNVGMFSEISFAVRWQGMLCRGYVVLQVTALI